MAAKKVWISSAEAAAILSRKAGRTISDAYVRQLALAGKIEREEIDGRTRRYDQASVEAYKMRGYSQSAKGQDQE